MHRLSILAAALLVTGTAAAQHAHGGAAPPGDPHAAHAASGDPPAAHGGASHAGHGAPNDPHAGHGGANTHASSNGATGPRATVTSSGFVMGAQDGTTLPAPMLMPIRAMLPGTWTLPGGVMVMGNFHGIATNPGFARAQDPALGRTHGYLLNDWIMARARTESGMFEGLLMLNFEPLSFGKGGWYQVGQAGEGLWDTQHQHQLFHQALLAMHLTGKSDGPFRATIWGGIGSATIGAPIFMHRSSNPSPTVPRKHHKGENPHETFPVIGATFQYHGSILDISAFSARELGADDSRLYPRVHAPKSFAARFRQQVGNLFEFQISGERLVEQGTEEDAYQVSSSVYGRYVGRYVVDWLLDGAIDIPAGAHDGASTHRTHDPARGALAEVAVRDATLRDVGWMRLELNDRIEPNGAVSKRWFFGSLGYERVVWVDPASVVGIGIFGEATLVRVPDSVLEIYGNRYGVTTTAGLHGQLMWMNAAAHGSGHAHHK